MSAAWTVVGASTATSATARRFSLCVVFMAGYAPWFNAWWLN
jgi:hypothetical protein